jgi:hypothetical protein
MLVTGRLAQGGLDIEGVTAAQASTLATPTGQTLFDRAALP